MAPALLYPRPLRTHAPTCPPEAQHHHAALSSSSSFNPHFGSSASDPPPSAHPAPHALPFSSPVRAPRAPPARHTSLNLPPVATVPALPRRTISAPAPVPAVLALAASEDSPEGGDDAVEELRAIFARGSALAEVEEGWLAATPRAGSTSTTTTTTTGTTILLPLSARAPSRSSGARSRAGQGSAHHGRRKSSGGSGGNGGAGEGEARSKRTPPGSRAGAAAWVGWEAVLHSPPSRALTRNPFPRHAHSALPVLQVGGNGNGNGHNGGNGGSPVSALGDEGGAFAARLRMLRSELGIVGTGTGAAGAEGGELEGEVVRMAIEATSLLTALFARAVSAPARTPSSAQQSRLLSYTRPSKDAAKAPTKPDSARLEQRPGTPSKRERERQLEEDIRYAWEWSVW
ncbi:hypothetical protein JCM10449v2_008199 [Rhodotorula kratochvilovae]